MVATAQFYSVYSDDALHVIGAQVGTVNYLLSTLPKLEPVPDATASSNEQAWNTVLHGRYRAGLILKLERFFLFEWFPRSPGLYFTPEGRQSREIAKNFLRRVQVPRPSGTQHLATGEKDREFLDVYDPFGKISMLKGGVGCIRLRDKLLDGGRAWFLSASSTGVAHEGFPVALPNHLYQKYVDGMKNRGALRCTLRGRLEFVPDPVVSLYREYRNVPQLYLLVEDLVPDPDQSHDHLLVSAGISFESAFEGSPKMYATYASFEPGVANGLEEVVDWLQEVYVQGLYSGRVITDFDEHMNHFAGATFSLRKVMDGDLRQREVETVIQHLHLTGVDASRLFAGLTTIQAVHAERVERMESKTINIGSGAVINAPVAIADVIQGSLNTIAQSGADADMKGTLERLIAAVTEAARAVPSAAAQNAARDTRNLVEEATASAPRVEDCHHFGERIKEWAKAIGEVGKPVLEVIAAALALLPH